MKKQTSFALVVVVCGLIRSLAHADSFQGLGDLVGGGVTSHADSISTDGTTVVGRGSGPSGSEAFRWTSGEGMVGLGDLAGGDFDSRAHGVSGDGSTVVGYGMSTFVMPPDFEFEAFRWTAASGMVGLGDLNSTLLDSWSLAASSDGSTVVGGGSGQAFLWTESGGMVGLGFLSPAHFLSSAEDISGDGSIVVGYSQGLSGDGVYAFRWTSGGGMVSLGELPGGNVFSRAYSVSSDGDTVVGRTAVAGGFEAFRWTSGEGMLGLGELEGGLYTSTALGVSTDGSVIVGQTESSSGQEAFLWEESVGMLSLRDYLEDELGLDLTGWTLLSAEDISGDGRTIVGHGHNANGSGPEGWIATIPEEIVVPEPFTTLLQACALLMLAALKTSKDQS
jgi:probable HAF family extracellular repeat protein